jgi:anaerobic selenocysteine-containing dehydrogenase
LQDRQHQPAARNGDDRIPEPAQPARAGGLSGTKIASLHLPVRINGDVAALKGVMKHMIEIDCLDHVFIRNKTCDFPEFLADLEATTWDEIESSSGLSRAQLRQAAEIAATSKRMITCWAMGYHAARQRRPQTCRRSSTSTCSAARSAARRGRLPGARSQQRAGRPHRRHLGTTLRPLRRRAEKEFNFDPPRKTGYDTVTGLQAMHEGKVKMFIALGGNFLSAAPDTEYGAEAFRRSRTERPDLHKTESQPPHHG